MDQNNVVHITPPSFYMGIEGTSVLFLGFKQSNIDAFHSVFEKYLYNTELQFFYTEKSKNDEEIIAWKYLVSSEVDFIVINIDDCEPEDLVIALMCERDLKETTHIVFLSTKEKENLSRIVQKYTGKVVKSLEEFDEVIKYILEEE